MQQYSNDPVERIVNLLRKYVIVDNDGLLEGIKADSDDYDLDQVFTLVCDTIDRCAEDLDYEQTKSLVCALVYSISDDGHDYDHSLMVMNHLLGLVPHGFDIFESFASQLDALAGKRRTSQGVIN